MTPPPGGTSGGQDASSGESRQEGFRRTGGAVLAQAEGCDTDTPRPPGDAGCFTSVLPVLTTHLLRGGNLPAESVILF